MGKMKLLNAVEIQSRSGLGGLGGLGKGAETQCIALHNTVHSPQPGRPPTLSNVQRSLRWTNKMCEKGWETMACSSADV
jgi:hypothetical protein